MVLKVPTSCLISVTESASEGACWLLPCKGCFFTVLFSKTLPEPQMKELLFDQQTPLCKNPSRTWLFLLSCAALICVWTWCCSDSSVLHSGSLLWGLPLVFLVGALGMGLVGLKHQHTRTILMFECLTLIPSGAFWGIQTCAPTIEPWLCGYCSWAVPIPWLPGYSCLQGRRMQGIRELSSWKCLLSAVLAQPSDPMSNSFAPVARSDGVWIVSSVSKTNGCAPTPQHFCGLFCVHI